MVIRFLLNKTSKANKTKDSKLLTNLLAAYNEALDSKRMSEQSARIEIETKYHVVFENWVNDRYISIKNKAQTN